MGSNTGFGKLFGCEHPPESLAELQSSLVRSHAGGVGQPLSEGEARGHAIVAGQSCWLKASADAGAGAGGVAGGCCSTPACIR